MVLSRLKELRKKNGLPHEGAAHSYILIVEDDPDQMAMLVDFAENELKRLISGDHISPSKKEKLKNVKLLTASNINSLKNAASDHSNVLLALLDGNIPDTKGGVAHDQFIKTGHKITGQHKCVDIVSEHLPNTPVTMISSMTRFQKIVHQYYKNRHDLSINFIRKKDTSIIQRNIAFYLRQSIK